MGLNYKAPYWCPNGCGKSVYTVWTTKHYTIKTKYECERCGEVFTETEMKVIN